MNPFFHLIGSAILCISFLHASPQFALGAEPVPPATGQLAGAQSNDRVLVLKEGGVLTGQIEQKGDHYVVTRPAGAVEVPDAKVAFVCKSLNEAYQQQRQTLEPNAAAHFTLAEWCLRNNLLEQAACELNEARTFDAANPRVKLLERRLALARDHVQHSDAKRGRAGEGEKSGHVDEPNLALSPTPLLPLSNTTPHSQPELEISREARDQFTRNIQPMLVNNCTNAGCHQIGGKQQFQLNRAVLHGLANRETANQNLAATLAFIDRDQPSVSPLLTAAGRAHGGMKQPVLGARNDRVVNRLDDWITTLSRPSADNEGSAAAREQSRRARDTEPTQPTAPVDENAAPQNDSQTAYSLYPRPPLKIGTHGTKWQPKDAFDPEIFNRQQSARNTAPIR